jgi:hypothetical protein
VRSATVKACLVRSSGVNGCERGLGRRIRGPKKKGESVSSEGRKPEATDRLFPFKQRWNSILDEWDLKSDREGNRRIAYSLRHTYISMRLMDGADIH